MAIVIHTLNKNRNRYAYNHYREGKKIKSDYIGPVDSSGKIRPVMTGQGVDRAKVGTTTAQLRDIYVKAVKKDEARKAEKNIEIIKEHSDHINQKAITIFDSEEAADEFLNAIEPHQTKGKSTIAYYIKDGKRVSKRKEVSPIIPYEITEAKEKSEREAEKKSEIKKLKKEHPKFTKSDIEYMLEKFGGIPEVTETGKKTTPAELKEYILEESYDSVKYGRLSAPESWDSHPTVKKHRDVILNNPDVAIESAIWNAQYFTKDGKKRKIVLSKEEGKKRAHEDIKIIKDFVEIKTSKKKNNKSIKFKYKLDKKFESTDIIDFENKILNKDGKEVGVFNYDILKNENIAYFDWIKINKNERGKGIPDEVTKQFVKDMKEQGITEIQMTSIKSKEEYWKKHGWELIPDHIEEGQMRYIGER